MNDEENTPAVDTEPEESAFAGLLRTRVNPALMPERPVTPPDPDGNFPVVLSVRVTTKTRDLAKRNALMRSMTMQDYIAMLIDRDASRS